MITKLEKEFTDKDGFLCEQVKETPGGYVYKETSPKGSSQFITFQKFFLHELDKDGNKTEQLREEYPNIRDFGFWAWAYPTKGKAKNKLNEIKAIKKRN